jgi:hypothetical protein
MCSICAEIFADVCDCSPSPPLSHGSCNKCNDFLYIIFPVIWCLATVKYTVFKII